MTPRDLVKKYFNEVKIMQLATSDNDEPWACNVHFYTDDELNFYWLSAKDRVHSIQIASNPNAAIAIKVQEDTPDDKDVIGISIAGAAKLLGGEIDKSIASGFIAKHQKPADFLDNVLDGSSPHQFYVLKPSKIVLFDTKNFPQDPRQNVSLS